MRNDLRQITAEHYTVQPNGCWLWNGRRSTKGYGHFYIDGKSALAHRAMYRQEIGFIPKGWQVHHVCGESMCVNPRHLNALSARDHVHLRRSMKLNKQAVSEIRILRQRGLKYREIAGRYSVAPETIGDIIQGRTWR